MEAFNVHAPHYNDITLLYEIIKQDPDFLHAFDRKQFVETPLRFAAGAGRKELALEIQILMPSFGMKLNGDGYSPLHLALQRRHTETVRAMVRLNPELVGVQAREGITLLHYAAEIDDVDMLAEFIVKCPDSIEKLTIREETALHVAVNCRKLAALKVLVGWISRKNKLELLEWKNWEGNTALHLAVSTNQHEAMEILHRKISKLNVKNNQELTALDLAMQLPKNLTNDHERALSILNSRRRFPPATGSSIKTISLAEYLSSRTTYLWELILKFPEYLDSGIPDEKRSNALVVAGLIATAAYQGMLQPPDFFSNQKTQNQIVLYSFHANGTVGYDVLVINALQGAYNTSRADLIINELYVGIGFVLSNCIALAFSLGLIFLLLPFRIYNILLHFSLFSLILTIHVILGNLLWSQPELNAGVNTGAFLLLVVSTILILMKFSTLGSRKRPHEI